jgi:uncharacterized protein with beta-barrel porin domain
MTMSLKQSPIGTAYHCRRSRSVVKLSALFHFTFLCLGDGSSTGAGLVLGVGAVLHAGAFTFEPRIGLDYDHKDQHGFTETGAGAANLRIGGEDRDALRSNVGTRLHAIWDFGSDQSLMPELSVAWAHNLVDPAVSLAERFVAGKNASFRIEGARGFLPAQGRPLLPPQRLRRDFRPL